LSKEGLSLFVEHSHWLLVTGHPAFSGISAAIQLAWILDTGCPAFSGISAALQLALVTGYVLRAKGGF